MVAAAYLAFYVPFGMGNMDVTIVPGLIASIYLLCWVDDGGDCQSWKTVMEVGLHSRMVAEIFESVR